MRHFPHTVVTPTGLQQASEISGLIWRTGPACSVSPLRDPSSLANLQKVRDTSVAAARQGQDPQGLEVKPGRTAAASGDARPKGLSDNDLVGGV